jgi:4-amino-4-deoxy-L-arabinose transferase-like glycosyltransferase
MPHLTTSRWSSPYALACIIAAQSALLLWGAYAYAPTYDEPIHLAAGVSVWRFNDLRVYHVNPPLAKSWTSLPAFLCGARVGRIRSEDGPRPEVNLTERFIDDSGLLVMRYVFFARIMTIPITLCGTCLCWALARRWYGKKCGLYAGLLWAFSPWTLGHGCLNTPDIPGAVAILLVAYLVDVNRRVGPNVQNDVIVGIAWGIALCTKFTNLFMFPAVGICLIWNALRNKSAYISVRNQLMRLVVHLAVAVTVVNCVFYILGAGTRSEPPKWRSRTLTWLTSSEIASRAPMRHIVRCAVACFPSEYIKGVDTQQVDFDKRRWSYLRGWQETGRWYYYVVGMLIKTPLCVVFLWVLYLCGGRLWGLGRRHSELRATLPVAIVVTTFVVVSSHSGMNEHVRYVMPALPFSIIMAAMAGSRITLCGQRPVWLQRAGCALVIGACLEGIAVSPNWIAYCNVVAGGPSNGHQWLLGSNVSWGQDLSVVAAYCREHPHQRCIVHTMQMRPLVHVVCPTAEIYQDTDHRESIDGVGGIGMLVPGAYVVDVNLVHDIANAQNYPFRERMPTGQISPSFLLYIVE